MTGSKIYYGITNFQWDGKFMKGLKIYNWMENLKLDGKTMQCITEAKLAQELGYFAISTS